MHPQRADEPQLLQLTLQQLLAEGCSTAAAIVTQMKRLGESSPLLERVVEHVVDGHAKALGLRSGDCDHSGLVQALTRVGLILPHQEDS